MDDMIVYICVTNGYYRIPKMEESIVHTLGRLRLLCNCNNCSSKFSKIVIKLLHNTNPDIHWTRYGFGAYQHFMS